jgi:hypothetical protein
MHSGLAMISISGGSGCPVAPAGRRAERRPARAGARAAPELVGGMVSSAALSAHADEEDAAVGAGEPAVRRAMSRARSSPDFLRRAFSYSRRLGFEELLCVPAGAGGRFFSVHSCSRFQV